MIKLLLLFLMIPFDFTAEYPFEFQSPLVTDIVFLEIKPQSEQIPPPRLGLGIYSNQEAVYKLIKTNEVICAGIFSRGYNTIFMEAVGLFFESGTHFYTLQIKAGERIEKIEFEIRVHLESSDEKTVSRKRFRNVEYELSIIIKDELIASSRKKHFDKFPLKLKFPPLHVKVRPFHPNAREDPLANAFSIPTLAAALIDILTGSDKKKNQRDPYRPPLRLKQIETKFLNPDSKAIGSKIKATLTLKILLKIG